MGKGVNKLFLSGPLAKKPELFEYTAGKYKADLRFPTNERDFYNKETKEYEEKTEWVSVAVWGRQAENAAKYLDKGHWVQVTATLENRKDTKDGKFRNFVNVQSVDYIGRPEKRGSSSQSSSGVPEVEVDPSLESFDLPF